MARPACARIDLEAIRYNYGLAKQLSGTNAVAIIKANAYGHGAVKVAEALADEADAFGVACIEEALELCESGIKQSVLLLEGVFTPDELEQVDRLGMMMAVHTPEQLQWLLEAKPSRKLDVLLKLDTGMHRLGFKPERAKELYAQLKACKHAGEVTLMSHFARADEVGEAFSQVQLQRFQQAITGLSVPVSMANSAGILAWPESHRAGRQGKLGSIESDWVRPGIMLYGADPLDEPNEHSKRLKPVMSLESEVIAVCSLEAGERIGYGGRFQCDKPTRVGVVAMGYADGYPRHAVDGTPVSIDGQISRIIGKVSMDMLTVDLTDIPTAQIGSQVELWGEQIAVNDVAAHSSTIAYTLYTGITRRVPLHYR
uniref:Alanine racemase n=1 Tax=uncultured Thiotrichaceae bacterium TaxID=298394 RepID=A0A6S6T6D5_9GAMM|nr:MAG: Alanine racemase (EC [uncultured Thiotrichaceae bacterium]